MYVYVTECLLMKRSAQAPFKIINMFIDVHLPKMYIIVKLLSKAIPTKNLQAQKDQNVLQNAVAIPAAKPTMFVPTRAGMRPCLSAIQPKTRPPRIAPPKKMAWAMVGRAEFSHTQFCWNTSFRMKFQTFKEITVKVFRSSRY